MGYFDNDKNVQDYMEMVEGYDGAELINALKDYLPKGSTLLELGMGPGKDLDILRARTKDVLNDGGILFHSFWYGNKEEEHHGLLFVYYLENQLMEIVKDDFEILEMKKYSEMETNDSIYIVLKKR